MTKKVETGAAPVSKYAAKKAGEVKTSVEATETTVEETKNSINLEKDYPDKNKHFTKPYKKFDKEKVNGLPAVTERFPEHVVQIALLIKNNAEIRRFTALGILNYLLQKGEIIGEKRYVSFKWNKFAVKANGLMREYSYNEPFFLNALVASFSSFSASAQKTIDKFCKTEMGADITKAIDAEEVNDIVSLNERYQNIEHEVVKD